MEDSNLQASAYRPIGSERILPLLVGGFDQPARKRSGRGFDLPVFDAPLQFALQSAPCRPWPADPPSVGRGRPMWPGRRRNDWREGFPPQADVESLLGVIAPPWAETSCIMNRYSPCACKGGGSCPRSPQPSPDMDLPAPRSQARPHRPQQRTYPRSLKGWHRRVATKEYSFSQ